MGLMFVFGNCCACGDVFDFNAERVPSIRGRYAADGFKPDPAGEREPVCRNCFEKFNRIRIARGLQPVALLPGAYEPQEVA
jgi:hypothetical protein